MRIAWDVSPLSHPRTGVGNYIRGSLAGLVEAAGAEHEIVAFAPTSPQGLKANPRSLEGIDVELRLRFLPFAHFWRQGWSRLGRPPIERFLGRLDVLHFSDWMYPPQRAGVRSTMIHDLVPVRFPGWVEGRTRRMHGAKYRNAARTCDLIFTNSEFTKSEVVELLGFPPEGIRVAPPGIDERFRADGPAAELGRPYLLSVATLEPRKNLGTLLEAHRLLGPDLALVLVGAAGWDNGKALEGPGVVRMGFVGGDELARLYRGAAAFVYPSRFEGFGMPIVEAMASGVPVVASSHPSLDEAAGDAAVRAEADDAGALAAAIERALADRQALVARGLAHAAHFTWRACGRTYLQGFFETLAA